MLTDLCTNGARSSKKNEIMIFFNWRLVRVTLVVAFDFYPNILGGDRDLEIILCLSMNAGSVVDIP